MAGDALSTANVREVEHIAELTVRRYFDHYLENVRPELESRLRKDMVVAVTAHDLSPSAHGGVERRFSRLVWLGMGAIAVSGGTGAVVAKLLSGLG